MLMDVDSSQLVLVDYQARLMPAMFESEWVLQCSAFGQAGGFAGGACVLYRAESGRTGKHGA